MRRAWVRLAAAAPVSLWYGAQLACVAARLLSSHGASWGSACFVCHCAVWPRSCGTRVASSVLCAVRRGLRQCRSNRANSRMCYLGFWFLLPGCYPAASWRRGAEATSRCAATHRPAHGTHPAAARGAGLASAGRAAACHWERASGSGWAAPGVLKAQEVIVGTWRGFWLSLSSWLRFSGSSFTISRVCLSLSKGTLFWSWNQFPELGVTAHNFSLLSLFFC